jgi:probable rRNA maturation factor
MDPDPAPTARTAKKTAASVLPVLPKDQRIPSARTLARFLSKAQAAVRLKGEVTVLLTTDAAIRKLNRNFRGKDRATDVLSFPAEGIGAEEIAGDLAISVPTALKQAVEQGHPLATEIKVLMLHGLLHLAGYDHETDTGKMARREGLLRARLGLPLGLIERAEKAMPQGLKPRISVGDLSARLKSRPDASGGSKGVSPQRVKARSDASKRSESCSSEFADSDSSIGHPARLRARPIKAIEQGNGSARKPATKRKRL